MNPIIKAAEDFNKEVGVLGIAPTIPVLSGGPSGREVLADGRKVLFFSSNNYLDLAGNPEIKKAIVEATNIYGFGSGASRLVGGTFDKHVELEGKIAEFKQGESAIIFSTGSIANDTVIPALLNVPQLNVSKILGNNVLNFFARIPEAAVFSDELNHASIVDGCRLAKVETNIYRHLDLNDLESKLRKSKAKKKLIVTDSVFSMDGDIVDIRGLLKLKEKYGALVYVDEAHTTGVLGSGGRGISEEYTVNGIDIKMGTFSKAFGGAGGFVVASKPLINYLKLSCRKYIFSTAMPPAQAAGLIKSIELVRGMSKDREHLKMLSEYFRGKLKDMGLDTLASSSQIIPIVIGDERKTMTACSLMRDRGVHTPAVIWPATGRGQGRLRVSLISSHTKEDVDHLLSNLQQVVKQI